MADDQMMTKELLRAGGSGVRPKRGDKVTVHCTGIVTETSACACDAESTDKKFWSTKDPGQSVFSFNVGMGQVVRGWDEALPTMELNESARFVIKSDWAYGPRGFPAWGIPPNATLTFEIELLRIG